MHGYKGLRKWGGSVSSNVREYYRYREGMDFTYSRNRRRNPYNTIYVSPVFLADIVLTMIHRVNHARCPIDSIDVSYSLEGLLACLERFMC